MFNPLFLDTDNLLLRENDNLILLWIDDFVPLKANCFSYLFYYKQKNQFALTMVSHFIAEELKLGFMNPTTGLWNSFVLQA